MRLFTKIFLFGMLVFGAAFSVSGYFLLHYSLESSMAREADFALKQYQYDKFTVQSAMLSYADVSVAVNLEGVLLPSETRTYTIWQAFPDSTLMPWDFYFWEYKPGQDGQDAPDGQDGQDGQDAPDGQDGQDAPDGQDGQDAPDRQDAPEGQTAPGIPLIESMFRGLAAEINVPVAFFAEDKTLLYSEIEDLDISFLDSLSEDAHAYRFQNTAHGSYVLTGSIIEWNGWHTIPENGNGNEFQDKQKAYFITQWDITKTIQQQDTLRRYFIRCYLAAMAAGMVLLGFLSALLTNPLKRMSKAARRMSEGYYRERLPLKGSDEMGTLAESFNQMADAVEDKIGELSRAAREKEDFVANFAHELKTPLTSIIGYADTIYQKELPREAVRRASWHIWNEGMRLEALSLKLMELTVLGRQDFPLTEMSAEDLLRDAAEGLAPILSKKQVDLKLQAAPGYVRADYDLMKTLLINLVDNSVKAGSSRITVFGQTADNKYLVSIKDNGCGMEEDELTRITEAFYMVDKARSRKQHGAGLGLALADRIAGIHGGSLTFESRKGEGTTVRFCLPCISAPDEDSCCTDPASENNDGTK